MSAPTDAPCTGGWHPIASASDLVPFHVHQAMLNGREFAVWRAGDGFVNVWENRCLHRGVRLTIGTHDGAELKCAYHGWRYANRTAGCTYVPAHPADAPARTICNTTYSAVERFGLVWTAEEATGQPPNAAWLMGNEPIPLRAVPANASSDAVAAALATHRFGTDDDPEADDASMELIEWQPTRIVMSASRDLHRSVVVFHIQPVDEGRCIIRGVLAGPLPQARLAVVLRDHNTRLTRLRDQVEADHAAAPHVDPALRAPIARVAAVTVRGRRLAPLEVRVRRRWLTATDIAAVELESTGDPLPSVPAGAHIDLHLPNGLVRQYSLTNGPGESDCYRVGVKLEPNSRGGSRYVHEALREGDGLSISEPRPSFPLRRDALRSVLIAGGIGVTPLLSMAQTLVRNQLAVELHYFARTAEQLAFPEIRHQLGSAVIAHLGLDHTETAAAIGAALGPHREAARVYICGPGPMLDTARRIAADLGWPTDAVHFEYFKNPAELDRSSSFEISLARSALTLAVPEGRSILDVLQEAGVPIASSCEQGACGTCVATVLDGEPDHQDVRLTDAEKAAGDRIMTCVSRSKSDRLVLDL